jgi:hypothetical protein
MTKRKPGAFVGSSINIHKHTDLGPTKDTATTNLTDLQLAALRFFAEKATAGPWDICESANSNLIHVETHLENTSEGGGVQIATVNRGDKKTRLANADFIAAASPSTITAMLDRINAQAEEITALLTAEARVAVLESAIDDVLRCVDAQAWREAFIHMHSFNAAVLRMKEARVAVVDKP